MESAVWPPRPQPLPLLLWGWEERGGKRGGRYHGTTHAPASTDSLPEHWCRTGQPSRRRVSFSLFPWVLAVTCQAQPQPISFLWCPGGPPIPALSFPQFSDPGCGYLHRSFWKLEASPMHWQWTGWSCTPLWQAVAQRHLAPVCLPSLPWCPGRRREPGVEWTSSKWHNARSPPGRYKQMLEMMSVYFTTLVLIVLQCLWLNCQPGSASLTPGPVGVSGRDWSLFGTRSAGFGNSLCDG